MGPYKLNEHYAPGDNTRENSSIAGTVNTDEGRNKNHAPRNFREIWLEVKAFNGWLMYDATKPQKASCSICKKTFDARLSTIKSHALSNNHLTKCGLEKPPSPADFQIPEGVNSNHSKEMAQKELQYLSTCVKINLPFKQVPVLLNDLKAMDRFGQWQDIKMGKTKARNMIVNVLGESSKEDLAKILKNNYFCICIDESTDISKEKNLVIIVRYVDWNDGYVKTRHWDLAPVFTKGTEAKCGSKELFGCLEKSFAAYRVPLSNIYACCSDGCQAMIGKRSGLKKILSEQIPGVIYVQCPAHITNLCVQHSLVELPTEVVRLFTQITLMLKSANKLHDFAELQKEMGYPQHKILNLSITRWLSLEACTLRLIEQWECLLKFSEKLSAKNDATAKEVFLLLSDPQTKCYFFLLRKTLHEINELNLFFQKRDVVIHEAKYEVEKRYKNIVSCFMRRTYVTSTPPEQIDILSTDNYLRFVDFELGEEIREYLLITTDNIDKFCKNIYNFLILLALEMKDRFNNFSNPLYETATCLNPKNITSVEFREKNPDIITKFINVHNKLLNDPDLQIKVDIEWHALPNIDVSRYINLNDARIEDIWNCIKTVQIDNLYPFRTIAEIALYVLAIPHANADPERAFSSQNNFKTKNKNKLLVATVDGLLQSKEVITCFGQNKLFEPTSNMIDVAVKRKFYKNKYKKGNVK